MGMLYEIIHRSLHKSTKQDSDCAAIEAAEKLMQISHHVADRKLLEFYMQETVLRSKSGVINVSGMKR